MSVPRRRLQLSKRLSPGKLRRRQARIARRVAARSTPTPTETARQLENRRAFLGWF